MSEAPRLDAFLSEAEPAGADSSLVRGVRRYLEAARAHVAVLHRESGSGRVVNEATTDLTDRLVRALFARAQARAAAEHPELPHRLAVAAVGGYGRREMSIHSDVDLLLLHPEPLPEAERAVAERLQYWLWDAGLSVGCAIRTVAETCVLAHQDETVRTSVLDARLLAGEAALFAEFERAVERDVLGDAESFLERLIQVRAERHEKFGESLYLLQPNVKEGAGGLRDYHGALWAMRGVNPGLRGLEAGLTLGLVTGAELVELRGALDFLWRVRNQLHFLAGRRNDQMGFAHQEEIARSLDYEAAAPAGEELPVERFMRAWYRHARVVAKTSDLILHQCLARVRPPGPPPPVREVEEGFRVVGDHLEIPHAAHLRERPVRLLRAFTVAQAQDVPLSRTALRLVRENLDLVDDAFRADPAAAAAFFQILAAERRVFRTLTALNEEGVLGAFLPEWEHLVCRWQHVMYHTYTVDVHTTFLVEQLRRLWRGKYERALPVLTDLVRSAEDRVVLFVGCLLHDVGKGWGGDHSRRGAEIARRCLERLGLEPERRERVVFLVAQHLVMSHVAQRRDLADPKVIVEFARLVGDRENLRNLYLLTFADTRASSPEAWTDWKGRLLRQLFERTSEFLETGGDDPARALEQVEAEVEARQVDARAELRGLGLAEARIDDFFATLPRRYFVSHDPREIARHARLVLGFDPAQGVALAVREMNDGSSELLLCTRDVHGLYAMVAGTLASRGLNILGSNVYTTRAGLALEVYRVAAPPGGEPERRLAWQAFETTLRDVLAGTRDLAELIRQRRRPLGRPQTPARHPPSVTITNSESDFYTILDVAADDRLGLLYDLTRTLADHGCEIYISKATTILDQVADTFYVKDAATGKKLRDRKRVERLREALLAVASAGPEGAGG